MSPSTKIDNITEKLQDKAADLDNRYIETNFQTNCRLKIFTHVLQSDVKEIVASAPAKSCELDPIPTSLLKMHIEVLAPTICNITNSSFDTGIFSDELKDALVCLLHKHHILELELKNFRPVSNLPYLGKIIEKLACRQIVKYTNSMGQMEKCQSAYWETFSTETALLKVKTDTPDAIIKKEVMCLLSLIRLLSLFVYILDESGTAENKVELLLTYDKLLLAFILRPLHQVTEEMLV